MNRTMSLAFTAVSVVAVVALGLAILAVVDTPDAAADPQSSVADLPAGFARGMDAIGSGDNAEAAEIFGDVYAPNVATEITFPDGNVITLDGREAFLGFVDEFFDNGRYTSTQHVVGSIRVDLDGDDAGELTWELAAFHHRADGSNDLGNGRWEAAVQHDGERWSITEQSLRILFFAGV